MSQTPSHLLFITTNHHSAATQHSNFRAQMATKMANRFRRSLSFPNKHNHHSQASSKPQKTLHNRSTSLPCRPHHTISQIRSEIEHLHSWMGSDSRGSDWLCDGFELLGAVHRSLAELLQLPRTRNLLRRGDLLFSDSVEKLLEDLLRFIDVHGRFRSLVLELKDECAAAEMAVRRRDGAGITARLRNLSRVGEQVGRLVSDLRREIVGFSVAASYGDESEIIEAINDVVQVTNFVSVSLFGGISASFAFRKSSYMGLRFGRWAKNAKIEVGIREIEEVDLENLWILRNRVEEARNASKKLHELESRTVEIGRCGERAFRGLIHTRVSLLNLFTL